MGNLSEKLIESLKKAGIKPLFSDKDKIKYDPNEIIEIYTPEMMVRHLPPERITRREYEKRIERENKAYHNWLIKFLKHEEYLEKHPPKSNIIFGYALAYN
jgi:hypothetical protein